jgi:hypothetical protein
MLRTLSYFVILVHRHLQSSSISTIFSSPRSDATCAAFLYSYCYLLMLPKVHYRNILLEYLHPRRQLILSSPPWLDHDMMPLAPPIPRILPDISY